jgi:C4-type Zn-finger protein
MMVICPVCMKMVLMNLIMLTVSWPHVAIVVYFLLACICLYNAGHKLDGFRFQFL